jgi:uncharacterized protein involved in exopolysaccharide biosynthesis
LPAPSVPQSDRSPQAHAPPSTGVGRAGSSISFRELSELLLRRRNLVGSIVSGLLLLCLLYCLITPNQYEASARIALRQGPASSLSFDSSEPLAVASLLSAPLQLETLADVFRSDRLAWRVITGEKLYLNAGFVTGFTRRFPGFDPGAPADNAAYAQAQSYLLERFQKRLHVQTLPRTLLIQIRFRSKDPALSAEVVNALISAYGQQDTG